MAEDTVPDTAAPEETVWVEDPGYRANGALVIPSDDADVDPVPPGTPLGNIKETADAYAPIHATLVRLSRNATERNATLDAMQAHWDPSALNNRIEKRVKAQLAESRKVAPPRGVAKWLQRHPVARLWL